MAYPYAQFAVRRVLRFVLPLCAALSMPLAAASPIGTDLRASPDGHYLTEADGTPFFWMGDTAWAIFERLTREEADVYLRDRAAKGFNIVQAVAIGGPFDTLEVPNRYGELALIDGDPLKPNPRYFDHIEWVVDRAAGYGIRIAMLPVWGSSLVGGIQTRHALFTPELARAYGEWIGKRFRGKGIVWVLGGDTNPVWPEGLNFLADVESGAKNAARYPVLRDYRPVYDAMAEGLLAGYGGAPMITYHPTPIAYSGAAAPRTSLYFGDRPWFGMNMLQSSHFLSPANEIFPVLRAAYSWNGTRNYEAVRDEYDSSPTRPVIDGEPRYEGLPIDIKWDPAKGSWKAYDARNAAYHAVFAGAAGHTFGNTSVHLSWDPAVREKDERMATAYPEMGGTWRVQLESEGGRQMQFLKRLMLSRPYLSRIPDQSIVVGDAGEGAAHIGATRDRSGSFAMVYIPDGRAVTLDLAMFSGKRLIGWWYDPRTGAAARIGKRITGKGSRRFAPPGGGADWVLVLDDAAAGFREPGSIAR